MATKFPKIPTHPSEILQDILFDGYGLTLEQSAKMLGVDFATLSNFINKKTNMSLDLAYRLDLANINSAAFWMAMQSNYDLINHINAQNEKPKVETQAFETIRKEKEKQIEAEESVVCELLTRKLLERERAERENTVQPPQVHHQSTHHVKRIREHAPARAHALA